MESDIFAQNWQIARIAAEKANLKIVEIGWEQHVIIDEQNNIVYRYPRHESAAAKLADEVAVLHDIHTHQWPVELPVMIEHTSVFTSYKYIAGEILNEDQLSKLSPSDFENIGDELGRMIYLIHQLPHQIIEQKQTRHTTTLLEYYTQRIEGNPSAQHFDAAKKALDKLTAAKEEVWVVVHGDLYGPNIVIDPATKKLNGIIDLSEMEVGNPAQEFRKLFMTDERLLYPAIKSYENAGGTKVDPELAKLWAYVNEWANVCYFNGQNENTTYRRAMTHLKRWQLV